VLSGKTIKNETSFYFCDCSTAGRLPLAGKQAAEIGGGE
jgi:hypothetical protein